ncbi:MAG: nitrite/sulfite reductase [Phycisphaerae bacterium]|jgi:sulfite reductase beta subunit-like hemoprotein
MTSSDIKSTFPCCQVPDAIPVARVLGIYPQVQEGLFMQRVRVPGGVLAGPQWRALAEAIRRFTPATPLHLTTRQEFELHDLRSEQIPQVQEALAEAGLTSLGSGGNALRNVTVCPCSGTSGPDLLPLAGLIQEVLQSREEFFTLPRKFKVSLSACGEGCGQPWINDLGFAARQQEGRLGFAVTVAGSLGPRPATAMLLADWLDARDVVPLALAALQVFAAHGDRQNRSQARLRHVRQRLGDEAFAALIWRELDQVRQQQAWPEVILHPAENRLAGRATLTFHNGDVSAGLADSIGRLADDPSLKVRIANHQHVIVFGPDAATVTAAVAGQKSLATAALPQPAIVACPGKRWCGRALTDTNAQADRLRADLAGKLPADKTICISGCPNGCAHSRVADIGLVGLVDSVGGQRRDVYDLYVRGGMGRDARLAEPAGQRLSPQEVLTRILAESGSAH